MEENELYHHGVKGQKWGVRRYQNPDGTLTDKGKKHVSNYKKREINKIAKHRLRQLRYDEKVVNRAGKSFDKKLDKYGQAEKTKKAARKYINVKSNAIANDNIAKREVERVSKMRLKDINREKEALGKAKTRNILRSIGTTLILGDNVRVIYTTDKRAFKTNMRVSPFEQEKIKKRAKLEAARDIYG